MENNTIINGLIIDDEPHCQDHLKTLIQENCPEIQVIGVLSSVREAESFIRKRLPDLIFLDVMMPGRNGFSLIDSIGRTNCPIIFTTAHSDFAMKAFRYEAVDYLLKPIQKDQLLEAVDRVSRLQAVAKNKAGRITNFDRIGLPSSEGTEFIDIADIIWCQADANYTHFHLVSGETRLITKTLREYDEILSAHAFFRIHRSVLINLAHVAKVKRGKSHQVCMSNGKRLSVAANRKDAFSFRLKQMSLG